MSKKELIEKVAKEGGITKADATRLVDLVLNQITGELKAGNKVNIPGFGVFDVRARPARKGRNPTTGGTIDIPASKSVAFKAGKALKDSLNG